MRYWFMLATIILFATTARAVDNGQWANSPNRGWYQAQELNPEARIRLGVSWKSCCEHSDVVKTRFRVERTTAADEWWWLDGNTWRLVPADIIHWNDPTPDGQPVLFVYSGLPTCFYPGETGG
jgi:hypothetical protein